MATITINIDDAKFAKVVTDVGNAIRREPGITDNQFIKRALLEYLRNLRTTGAQNKALKELVISEDDIA